MSELKLSRVIPSRKKTIKFLWCKEWMEMSEGFRKIRPDKQLCFWCRYPFEDGNMMWLAAVIGKGNKVLCKTCATETKEDN